MGGDRKKKRGKPTRGAVLGLGAAVLIAVLLMLIPYKTMREERMFALSSQETFAKVEKVSDTQTTVGGEACRMVRYRFVDGSGVTRQGESCLPPDAAGLLSPGSVLPVVYATGNPDYSEAAAAVQDPVKRWIKKWSRGE